jgi:hypothetical protein
MRSDPCLLRPWRRNDVDARVRHANDWEVALPFAENEASCRVLEKADYRMEGVPRGSAVKAGRVMDQALFARVDLSRGPSLTPDSRGP